MESESYYLTKQLEQYKRAISDAMIQFQLDDESRIAAARYSIRSIIAEFKEETDVNRREAIRNQIDGMLKIAVACHLISMEDLKQYKKTAGIESVDVTVKISF